MMEFHISREARNRYQFAETLFSFSGNVVFANLAASREFAYRMNQVRQPHNDPKRVIHAGALYAMGLIDEASHVLMAQYRLDYDPNVMTDALPWIAARVGGRALDRVLLSFVEHFPGSSVYRGQESAKRWLGNTTNGTPNRAIAFEEMVLLWMANHNEAFKPFGELFDDRSLAMGSAYRAISALLPEYFATRPLVAMEDSEPQSLFHVLRAPALSAPGSLREQLTVIRKKWSRLLGTGTGIGKLIDLAGEILQEEELAIWLIFNPPNPDAEAAAREAARAAAEEARRRREALGLQQWPADSHSDVPEFGDATHETEEFSQDVAWMPEAVMIAKSTYVWLAQLSRQYGRDIRRLDQVPDEELDLLAHRGMNTLWLIGVWERSRASQTIKQLCGNHDAVASAYSLFDYRIADDLGGEAAYVNLRDRAYHRGLRLASDMVPNHMGIDSPWVVEHPDWFIARQEPPYPSYDFGGPDLSPDPRVEIKIERHYYDQTDAAVVFMRRDRQSGETRFIYHGNDGTSFPWNDTAQLDYLNPAVREQVIQTILHVARLFPVIRFDAAMTLAKRHFHRLWFPGPGASGAIPSRAEYGMSNADFNRAMPQEFWREVVDRVAREVPGTLLLAEAFWLMEGYFVRTLGMHRVYNSAFMNMMRDEENAKYRSVIKNTLEFDPDIMKRYVNFMSNPDERTAIDQFGDGDKCFGVAAMMATLPGLPMFGHGQVEGFTEKYGMEYRWPRREENPNPWLVERHDRQIAPLLHKRALFAESTNFLLYDFYSDYGGVDENVFAYSNRRGHERGLVLYNNRFNTTRGTIDWSAAYADKGSGQQRQQRLGQGLALNGDHALVYACRNALSGLWHLYRANHLTEQGLHIELHAYQCYVLVDWQELHSTAAKPWDRLCDHLQGHGVNSLDDALISLKLEPTHQALQHLLEPTFVNRLAELAEEPRQNATSALSEFSEIAWQRMQGLLTEAQHNYRELGGAAVATETATRFAERFRNRLLVLVRIPALESEFGTPWTAEARQVLPSASSVLLSAAVWAPALALTLIELLAEFLHAEDSGQTAVDLFDRLRLREPLARSFERLGVESDKAWRASARIKIALLTHALAEKSVAEPTRAEATVQPTSDEIYPPAPWPIELWQDPDLRWLLGIHSAGNHTYFVREGFAMLVWWLQLPALFRIAAGAESSLAPLAEEADEYLLAAEKIAYRLDTNPVSANVSSPQEDEKGETTQSVADSEPQ